MKKIAIFFCISLSALMVRSQSNDISIIPEPVQLVKKQGTFLLPEHVSVNALGVHDRNVIQALWQKLKVTGSSFSLFTSKVGSPSIILSLNVQQDTVLGKEGYHLTVTTENIIIRANEAAGLFYGLQTLFQL